MTYWVLPTSGIPISTDTVQVVPPGELESEAVKEQMERWKQGTSRVLDAKSSEVVWKPEDNVRPKMLFDLESEDEEFTRNFNMQINTANLDGTDKQELEDEPNAPTYVGMEVGLRRGAEGDLQQGRVKCQAVGEEARPVGVAHSNPLLDTRKYEVEYEDGTSEVLAANLLAESILEQVDEHGHKHRLMEEISGHRKNEDAMSESEAWYETQAGTRRRKKTTKGWELYFTWKDGSSNYIPLSEMKESFPIETAQYAVDREIQHEPAFIWWVSHVLKKRTSVIKKVKSKYWERTHKYGIKIPKNVAEAIRIDRENGNTLWQDAIKQEMKNS